MTGNQTQYFLEPHDPLLIRDGRPFTAGGFAISLPFVLPTTLAGLIRTTAGRDGTYAPEEVNVLRQISLTGPVLCSPEMLYFPAPRDAVVFSEGAAPGKAEKLVTVPLLPASPPKSVVTNLEDDLQPLTLTHEKKDKPASKAPAFWPCVTFLDWLKGKPSSDLKGIRLEHERRIHVAIDPESGSAQDGRLFGTSSLSFQQRDGSNLGLLFATDARLPEEALPFGGERRLSTLRTSQKQWPGIPPEVLDSIVKTGRARIVLLTPAMFRAGWKPTTLLTGDLPVTLRAAAVGRPEVSSGWDLEAGQPKPTRRLAPAGSVYFVELGGSPEDRRNWVMATWMVNVSDDLQDRRDGLGLAALGIWKDESGRGGTA